MTAECDPMPQFQGKTCDDAVSYTLRLTGLYRDCSAKHSSLSRAVR